ncbi:unnamed protein product [Phyllotreta striolata]|uniref:Uncharacterized protein n=1 Tax=Phyllotreta striolata TaxID=444603 RepID=A0A9N9TRD6_PHYSR|nr:unnamed protein product [Phyllotreta striolata]
MIPPNLYPTLFLSKHPDYILFKLAIYFAEQGHSVWFISPKVFESIPEDIRSPDKEILQSITFVYLQDYKSLINHLNAIHLWHKVPTVVLMSGFDVYTKLYGDTFDPLLPAIVTSSLFDGASVCSKKNKKPVFVIVAAYEPPRIYLSRYQSLHDLYYPNFISNGEKSAILKKVVDYYGNNKFVVNE